MKLSGIAPTIVSDPTCLTMVLGDCPQRRTAAHPARSFAAIMTP
jgi:hypothetical protein